ncbi:1457_t:CDS:2, partial [Gigaspora rosea]
MEYDNYDMNSDNNSSEDDETFDNLSEIFDKTDFNIKWNSEDQFASHLHFGPEIPSELCKELWEGNLWAKSPLFGQSNITISR